MDPNTVVTTTGTVAEWSDALMEVAGVAFITGIVSGFCILMVLAQLWGFVVDTKWYRARAARARRREALRWRMIRSSEQ